MQRVEREPGASEEITFEITPEMMELVNLEEERVLESGDFKVYMGGSTPGRRSTELGIHPIKEAIFTLR